MIGWWVAAAVADDVAPADRGELQQMLEDAEARGATCPLGPFPPRGAPNPRRLEEWVERLRRRDLPDRLRALDSDRVAVHGPLGWSLVDLGRGVVATTSAGFSTLSPDGAWACRPKGPCQPLGSPPASTRKLGRSQWGPGGALLPMRAEVGERASAKDAHAAGVAVGGVHLPGCVSSALTWAGPQGWVCRTTYGLSGFGRDGEHIAEVSDTREERPIRGALARGGVVVALWSDQTLRAHGAEGPLWVTRVPEFDDVVVMGEVIVAAGPDGLGLYDLNAARELRLPPCDKVGLTWGVDGELLVDGPGGWTTVAGGVPGQPRWRSAGKGGTVVLEGPDGEVVGDHHYRVPFLGLPTSGPVNWSTTGRFVGYPTTHGVAVIDVAREREHVVRVAADRFTLDDRGWVWALSGHELVVVDPAGRVRGREDLSHAYEGLAVDADELVLLRRDGQLVHRARPRLDELPTPVGPRRIDDVGLFVAQAKAELVVGDQGRSVALSVDGQVVAVDLISGRRFAFDVGTVKPDEFMVSSDGGTLSIVLRMSGTGLAVTEGEASSVLWSVVSVDDDGTVRLEDGERARIRSLDGEERDEERRAPSSRGREGEGLTWGRGGVAVDAPGGPCFLSTPVAPAAMPVRSPGGRWLAWGPGPVVADLQRCEVVARPRVVEAGLPAPPPALLDLASLPPGVVWSAGVPEGLLGRQGRRVVKWSGGSAWSADAGVGNVLAVQPSPTGELVVLGADALVVADPASWDWGPLVSP